MTPCAALLRALADRLARAGVARPAAEAARIARAAEGDGSRAHELVERRLAGAPLGCVLGRVEFLGLPLEVASGVLAPREETELLAKSAIAWLRAGPPEPVVVDMCCGAGNLACAIASAVPGARVWAADCSEAAVRLTAHNASLLGLGDRVTALCGDLFAPLRGLGLEGRVEAVVCNPPYISSGRLDGPSRALMVHEPREAFDGGPYGLAIHQRVVREATDFVRPGGLVAVEIGRGQRRQIEALLRRARGWGEPVMVAGGDAVPRVALARRRRGL
ncbi:MAG: peptide chain release factor N(5)-glutamine methyltransferase [Sandaracinaceae bacterium]|nr:peptide chain release factor N(5)-glutamine methyltransferase [Sandaracinaceae bacterium]